MKKIDKIFAVILFVALIFSISACSPVDKLYGVESDTSSIQSTVKTNDDVSRPLIMSSDRVMSQFIDISLFDEENYSKIYLGKKFKFNVSYCSDEFTVPTKLSKLKKKDWQLVENSQYDEDSLIYACESVEVLLQNPDGAKIEATIYNSSNSSLKLSKCNIVKFKIDNDFYTNPDSFFEFNVNGINNKMAITDVIDTLGTPSHFYPLAGDSYYLDYFISESDRRNGITVYINPNDDSVTAVEFSYYK